MAGDRYYITDQHQTYFINCTIVDWIDLFSRPFYQEIIINSLNYCVCNKGLKLNGWVSMSNHLHFAGRCEEPNRMSDFLRHFKKFTSKALAADCGKIKPQTHLFTGAIGRAYHKLYEPFMQ